MPKSPRFLLFQRHTEVAEQLGSRGRYWMTNGLVTAVWETGKRACADDTSLIDRNLEQ
jgi:hypothetical protein